MVVPVLSAHNPASGRGHHAGAAGSIVIIVVGYTRAAPFPDLPAICFCAVSGIDPAENTVISVCLRVLHGYRLSGHRVLQLSG